MGGAGNESRKRSLSCFLFFRKIEGIAAACGGSHSHGVAMKLRLQAAFWRQHGVMGPDVCRERLPVARTRCPCLGRFCVFRETLSGNLPPDPFALFSGSRTLVIFFGGRHRHFLFLPLFVTFLGKSPTWFTKKDTPPRG
jgi:hypothetical protein